MSRKKTLEEIGRNAVNVPFMQSSRRLGLSWFPILGDWFTAWRPNHGPGTAEGPWGDWVDLAVLILRHPLTAQSHPELYQLANEYLQVGPGEKVDPETIYKVLEPQVPETDRP